MTYKIAVSKSREREKKIKGGRGKENEPIDTRRAKFARN